MHADLLTRLRSFRGGFWAPGFTAQCAEALDIDDAADLIELGYAALCAHADERRDVPDLTGLDDLVSALRRLPPGHEYQLAQARAERADFKMRAERQGRAA